MIKHRSRTRRETIDCGSRTDINRHIQDEILTLSNFMKEFLATETELVDELEAGSLPILTRSNQVFIARTDANNWFITREARVQRRQQQCPTRRV